MLKASLLVHIFLDNSINERQFGYQLITPFVYGNNTILVLRGWVKGSSDRSILPNVDTSYDKKNYWLFKRTTLYWDFWNV